MSEKIDYNQVSKKSENIQKLASRLKDGDYVSIQVLELESFTELTKLGAFMLCEEEFFDISLGIQRV